MSWNSVSSAFQGAQLVSIAIAALLIAAGAWRDARWAPKASVTLAALSGVTNFSSIGAIFLVKGVKLEPAVVLTFALIALLGLCQLWSLFRGLKRLEYRPAAV
jgi:hypothetical protein